MNNQISIKLRPNNQIIITRGNYREKPKDFSNCLQHEMDRIPYSRARDMGDEIRAHREMYPTFQKIRKLKAPPQLDIIKKSQRSRKPFACRLNKPKSFTRFSGQKIRESGAAMNICSGNIPRFSHEVTLTLPANTKESFVALAAYSGYAINRLFQPIRRNYGDMCLWFFVWEYQKRGAPHLHIAIYHPDETEGMFICYQLIEQWHKILCDISDLANCCMFTDIRKDRCTIRSKHQHHTAPIRKNVAAYFAKYAGKTESKTSAHCMSYPVSRFWGSCYSIKKIIKDNSFSATFDYGMSEELANEKEKRIIDRILLKIGIVSCSSYQFEVVLNGRSRINRYKEGKKVLAIGKDICICRGQRMNIYFEQRDFSKALELIREEASK